MKNQTLIKMLALGVASLLALTGAQAATITWTGQGTLSNDTFLTLAGSTADEVYGVDFGGSGSQTTSNGYTFADNVISGDFTISTASHSLGAFSGYLNGQTSGDTGLNTILANGNYGDATNTGTLTGLTVGTTYTVLAFIDDNRGPNPPVTGRGGSNFQLTDGVTTSSTQAYAGDTPGSPLGGYIMGTFTADATTQAFTVEDIAQGTIIPNTQYNGILLETGVVPEPSTIALCLSGLLVLGVCLFRRRLA